MLSSNTSRHTEQSGRDDADDVDDLDAELLLTDSFDAVVGEDFLGAWASGVEREVLRDDEEEGAGDGCNEEDEDVCACSRSLKRAESRFFRAMSNLTS